VVCRQIKFQSYSISSQQPPLSLTQPTSPWRKHPRSTGFANLNKKEAFPRVSKHPRCLQINIKKEAFPSVAETPKSIANLKIYVFFQVF
jgi:muramidase (phage lysozyme)